MATNGEFNPLVGDQEAPPPPKIDAQNRLIVNRNDVTPPPENVPNNVSSVDQLHLLPPEFLSDNKTRPLQFIDDKEQVLQYALKPMVYSVVFILLVELLERFSFYGINYTQTSFLTGVYNEDWNADMTAIEASSMVSISIAIAYTSPFLGAFLADSFLGDYWTILVGCCVFYIPGLLLIAATTVPYLLGDTFNKTALRFGLLCLWPIGTGIVKSVVNVFGAKQFHPLIQSALIESYYVNFYMCINIGALAGGMIVPILAQTNVTAAYFIPVGGLSLGVFCFLFGSRRYVVTKPRGDLMSTENDGTGLSINAITKVCMLIIPFNIAYSQMATTFIVQGNVMNKAFGFIDAASMNNADAVAVLFFGNIIGNHIYPYLASRGIKFPTTYKFALGSAFGSLAIAWALLVEYWIRSTFAATGDGISVLWQAPSYLLIGVGEIFAVSAAYEVAFTAAPPQKKALASAINLFNVGGLPSLLCLVLYHACSKWFENASGRASIHTLDTYTEAHIYKYFCVLFCIALIGVLINGLTPVKNWVQSIEDLAVEAIKTPMATPKLARRKQEREAGENLPLLQKMKKHQNYMKYGTGPILHKSGSMRAAPFLKKTDPKALERQQKYVQQIQLRQKLEKYSKGGEQMRSNEAPY